MTRHVLRFEVSGEALASFREAMTKLRREAGEALDDDAAPEVVEMAECDGQHIGPVDVGSEPSAHLDEPKKPTRAQHGGHVAVGVEHGVQDEMGWLATG